MRFPYTAITLLNDSIHIITYMFPFQQLPEDFFGVDYDDFLVQQIAGDANEIYFLFIYMQTSLNHAHRLAHASCYVSVYL